MNCKNKNCRKTWIKCNKMLRSVSVFYINRKYDKIPRIWRQTIERLRRRRDRSFLFKCLLFANVMTLFTLLNLSLSLSLLFYNNISWSLTLPFMLYSALLSRSFIYYDVTFSSSLFYDRTSLFHIIRLCNGSLWNINLFIIFFSSSSHIIIIIS